MFLTLEKIKMRPAVYRRNPLKSGQCFLHGWTLEEALREAGRNPLKSGQCFLR